MLKDMRHTSKWCKHRRGANADAYRDTTAKIRGESMPLATAGEAVQRSDEVQQSSALLAEPDGGSAQPDRFGALAFHEAGRGSPWWAV